MRGRGSLGHHHHPREPMERKEREVGPGPGSERIEDKRAGQEKNRGASPSLRKNQ